MSSQNEQISFEKRFYIYHFPAFLYAILIIVASTIPNLRTPEWRFFAFDKLAHFIEYAVFSFLIFRSFSNFRTSLFSNFTFVLPALFLCLFAAFDEYYQRFIVNRTSDIFDFLADIFGAFLVLIFMWVRLKRAGKTTD